VDAAILTVSVLSLCVDLNKQADRLETHLPPFRLSSPYPTPFRYVLARPESIEVHPPMDPEGELRIEVLPSGSKVLFDSREYGARTVVEFRGPYLMVTRLPVVGLPRDLPRAAVFFSDGRKNYALISYRDVATGRAYVALCEIALNLHELVRVPVPISLDLGERLSEFTLYDNGTFSAKFEAGGGELVVRGSLRPPGLSVEWDGKGELIGEKRPILVPGTSWALLNKCPVIVFGQGTNDLLWPDREYLVWRILTSYRSELEDVVEEIVKRSKRSIDLGLALLCAYSTLAGLTVDALSQVRLPRLWSGPWAWLGAVVETVVGIPVLEWGVLLPIVTRTGELIGTVAPVDRSGVVTGIYWLTVGWYEAWLRRVIMRTCGLSWWETGMLWGALDALFNSLKERSLNPHDLMRRLTFHVAASLSPVLEVALYAENAEDTGSDIITYYSSILAAMVRWPEQSLPFQRPLQLLGLTRDGDLAPGPL